METQPQGSIPRESILAFSNKGNHATPKEMLSRLNIYIP